MISQVLFCNQDGFPAVAQDYADAKNRAEKVTKTKPEDDNSILTCALETVPTFRRTASLKDKADDADYAGIIGVLGLTFANIKEDCSDVKGAVKQIYSYISKNDEYKSPYNKHDLQHEFSFTRGIIGEEQINKLADNGNFIAQKVKALDETIDKSNFGKWIFDKFKIKQVAEESVDGITNCKGEKAKACGFTSEVFGGETIARAMKRTTKAGMAVMGLTSLPSIVSESTKSDKDSENIENGAKKAINVTSNIVLSAAGIGICGAIGAKHFESAGSLIGMGIGAVLSNKISKQINEAVN